MTPPRQRAAQPTNADLLAEIRKTQPNGEWTELKKMLPDLRTVASLAPHVPDLIAVATVREDSRKGHAWLRRVTGWDHGIRGVLILAATAAITVLVSALLSHWLNLPPAVNP